MVHYFITRWDTGLRNSYRMGAEGKYDLKLASSGSREERDSAGSPAPPSSVPTARPNRHLNTRKSLSTPSLPDATDNQVYILLNFKLQNLFVYRITKLILIPNRFLSLQLTKQHLPIIFLPNKLLKLLPKLHYPILPLTR